MTTKSIPEWAIREAEALCRTPWDALPKPRPVHPYIQQLQIESDAAHAIALAQRAEKERAEAQAARERLTPLETRVSKLLATIPDAVQREGLTLASLQASLRGRWRGNCHPGELGTALRKLGFERKRQWHGAAGFRAMWYLTG